MAFSYCLRRSSSIVPLAIRSAFDVQNSRRLLRSPPFLRRFSSTPPPSAGSPTQTSDESLDGLPKSYKPFVAAPLKMAYSSCVGRSTHRAVPLAIRLLGSSIEHRGAIFQNHRLLSANHVTVIESAIDNTVSRVKSPEVFSIPNGFPFAIRKCMFGLQLTREDHFEKTIVTIYFSKHRVEDGNPSVEIYATVHRGYILTNLEAVLKPNSISIYCAQIREFRDGHLEPFEEFLEAKGINNAGFLNYLFDFFNKKQKEERNKCAN